MELDLFGAVLDYDCLKDLVLPVCEVGGQGGGRAEEETPERDEGGGVGAIF